MPPLLLPMASRTPLSNVAMMKWLRPTTSTPGSNSGPCWPAHFPGTIGRAWATRHPTWHGVVCMSLAQQACFLSRCPDRCGHLGTQHARRRKAPNLQWAMSASPLIVDDLGEIFLPRWPEWVVSRRLNHRNGDVVWHVLNDGTAYTSPMLATLGASVKFLS
ncbi:MAG: hypothetical protein CM1200mP25_1560 [Acidobacteriota bacterium]|nr:MAG: hypothetical protein CM1200mP25_1560 [Acidobacteriota bacterium]